MLKSDRLVGHEGEEQRIDTVHEQVELTDREIDGETYKIWTKKLPGSKLGEQKVVIAVKVPEDEDTDEAEDEAEQEDKDEEEQRDEEEGEEEKDNPVKYFVTNKIDAPSAHIIGRYGFR